jgi:hypothetical protein
VASGLLFALTAAGAHWAFVNVSTAVAPAVAVAALAAVVSPAGTLVSAWTLWAGVWVSSCPYCAMFDLRRFRPTYFVCDECGEPGVQLEPLASDLAVTHHGDETKHTCRGCA